MSSYDCSRLYEENDRVEQRCEVARAVEVKIGLPRIDAMLESRRLSDEEEEKLTDK